jgi:hypothetical protein
VSVIDASSIDATVAVAGDPLTTPTRSESPGVSLRTLADVLVPGVLLGQLDGRGPIVADINLL